MRLRIFSLLLVAVMLPVCWGCGGSESSYKDRQGDIDPATVPLDSPEKPQ